jgi:hypothetical protein
VNRAGDKVSDAADRLAGWIRSGGGPTTTAP